MQRTVLSKFQQAIQRLSSLGPGALASEKEARAIMDELVVATVETMLSNASVESFQAVCQVVTSPLSTGLVKPNLTGIGQLPSLVSNPTSQPTPPTPDNDLSNKMSTLLSKVSQLLQVVEQRGGTCTHAESHSEG